MRPESRTKYNSQYLSYSLTACLCANFLDVVNKHNLLILALKNRIIALTYE